MFSQGFPRTPRERTRGRGRWPGPAAQLRPLEARSLQAQGGEERVSFGPKPRGVLSSLCWPKGASKKGIV